MAGPEKQQVWWKTNHQKKKKHQQGQSHTSSLKLVSNEENHVKPKQVSSVDNAQDLTSFLTSYWSFFYQAPGNPAMCMCSLSS